MHISVYALKKRRGLFRCAQYALRLRLFAAFAANTPSRPRYCPGRAIRAACLPFCVANAAGGAAFGFRPMRRPGALRALLTRHFKIVSPFGQSCCAREIVSAPISAIARRRFCDPKNAFRRESARFRRCRENAAARFCFLIEMAINV